MLTQEQLEKAMTLLDGTSYTQEASRSRARALIFAYLEEPSAPNWQRCYSVIIDALTFRTLWMAVLDQGYNVTFRPEGEPWPQLPTVEQVMKALEAK